MADTIQVDLPAPSSTAPWGYHAVMDCDKCDGAKIKDVNNIKSWLADLASKLAATSVIDANVAVTPTGHTAVQVFENASVIARFVDVKHQVYIDILSCAAFDPVAVETAIKTFFGSATEVKKVLLPRNAAVSAA